jgi:hypothetical protein
MLKAIEDNPDLCQISGESCHENNVGVDICDDLLAAGLLDHAAIKILKVDRYYSSRNFAMPPKSIDCLIVVKCESGTYELTLVELRDVSSTKGIKPRDILDKFRTIFVRFMTEDFQEIFSSPDYEIAAVRAWLVSDPFNAAQLPDDIYHRKLRGTVLDRFQSEKPFLIGKHAVFIQPQRPNPTVCTC